MSSPGSWCQPAPQYQPLPISTGTVGIDRCGNIEVYAAPGVVRARVCWPTCGWPVPAQLPGWCPRPGGWGGSLSGLASVLKGGAPMAQWMLCSRQAT